MAFEEIKAKLGLDITPFQQGVSKAQVSLKTLSGEATKKFTDLKQVGQAAATVLGLSVEKIAEKVARLWTGVSKETEESLKDLVDSTGKAADQQVAALERARQKNKKLGEDVAKGEADARFERLSDEQKLDVLYKRRTQLMQVAANTKEGSTVNLQARSNLIETNKLIEKVSDEKFAKEISQASDIKDSEEKLAEIRKQNALKRASDEEKIKILQDDILEARAQVTAAGKDEAAVTKAKIVLEEKIGALQDEQGKQAEARSKKQEADDKKREDRINKIANAEESAAKKAADLRAARIQDVKPTMEEVTSGKRNIGIGARENARRLEREQAKSLRLADQTQRAYEAIGQAKTPTERRDAQRAYDASRMALEASQERIKRGQEILGTRISDANPYAKMEAELTSIKTELNTLNTKTLGPTSTK